MNRKNQRNQKTEKECITMNPVLSILYSQDCLSFTCFLKLKLILSGFGEIVEECVEDLNFPLKPSKLQNLSRCSASAIIITRGYLRFLETHRDFSYKISCCLRPSTTIAFLLGIGELDIQHFHKTILVSYCSWPKFVISEGDVIPSRVVCAIRDAIFGVTGKTSQAEDNNVTTKNTESLQSSDEIQHKEATMKNTSCDKTTGRYPRTDEDENLKTRVTEASTKSEDIKEQRAEENSESPIGTSGMGEKDASEKNTESPIPLQRKSVVKKRKMTIKTPGTSPQMREKDDMAKKKEEKAVNENSETFQQLTDMNDQGKMSEKNVESEKTDHIHEKQVVMENAEFCETSEETVDVELRLKRGNNSENSKRIRRNDETEPLKNIDDGPLTYTESQMLIKSENAQEEETEERVEKSGMSPKNDVQEKGDFEEQVTRKNIMSLGISSKTDDTQTQGTEILSAEPKNRQGEPKKSKELEQLGGSEKRGKKLKNTEPSQLLKEQNCGKRKTSKNNGKVELWKNMDCLDVGSFVLLDTADATEENSKEKNLKNFQSFEGTCGVHQKIATDNTESFLSEEIIESFEGQEILSEIVMVPERVQKDNDRVFLIFTSLLSNIENVYVLLERNIITETPIHLMNPYVVYFFIPEQFLDVEGTVNIHIRYENLLLAVKRLSIVSASQTACHHRLVSEATSPFQLAPCTAFRMFEEDGVDNEENNPCLPAGETFEMSEDDATVTQSDNGEDLQCDGNDFSKTDGNEFDGGSLPSFLEFFAHYGFGELDDLALDLLTEGNVQTGSTISSEGYLCLSDDDGTESVTLRETINRKRGVPHRASLGLPSVSSDGTTSQLRRSASLPSLPSISPVEEDNEYVSKEESEEEKYLEMLPGYSARKPHEKLLDEILASTDSDTSPLSSLSSNVYVSMKPTLEQVSKDNDPAAIDLSKSQKELLRLLEAFKTGEKTLSEVEGLFNEWLVKHRDSVDDRDVILRSPGDEIAQKKRKGQPFSLIDIMRLRSGKPKPNKKTKAEVQSQDAKVRRKTYAKDKVKDRSDKTLSKVSTSSASSACSLNSEPYQTNYPVNQERKRDSGNHSDSNEDNKGKTLTADDKSTKWFLPLTSTAPYCSIPGNEAPPSLPLRPPPSAPFVRANEKRPNLPDRPPPKLRECGPMPPILPPKPNTLSKGTSAKKANSKSKDSPPPKPKRYPRDASPPYITPTIHPRSPPKVRDKFKQAIHPTPSQVQRNNYALERLKLSVEPPRKISAPEIRARSNSPKKIPNTPAISPVAISPLTLQKEHHNRYKKPLLPEAKRSTSCPNLLKTGSGDENRIHTYMELQGDANHK